MSVDEGISSGGGHAPPSGAARASRCGELVRATRPTRPRTPSRTRRSFNESRRGEISGGQRDSSSKKYSFEKKVLTGFAIAAGRAKAPDKQRLSRGPRCVLPGLAMSLSLRGTASPRASLLDPRASPGVQKVGRILRSRGSGHHQFNSPNRRGGARSRIHRKCPRRSGRRGHATCLRGVRKRCVSALCPRHNRYRAERV